PAPGTQSFLFSADGIDDGRYTIALAATGPDGKQVLASVTVAVDRTLSALTVTPVLFSPNSDWRLDTLTVSFTLAGAVPVRVRIVDASGNPVTVLANGPLEAGPQTFSWDGSKRVGRLLDGVYAAEVELEEPAGALDHSFSFVSDTLAPTLTRLSPKSLSFRLSEDATVTLTVGARSYVRRANAGIVSFWLASVQKQFSLVAEDAAGNRSSLP
ncbi:MAG: FlgD immunoglobulin-like domain containing protein, partial [Gaiellaceae bacterium]